MSDFSLYYVILFIVTDNELLQEIKKNIDLMRAEKPAESLSTSGNCITVDLFS